MRRDEYIAEVTLNENILCMKVTNYGTNFEIITTPGKNFQQITGLRFKFNCTVKKDTSLQIHASQLVDFYLDFISPITNQIASKLYYKIEIRDYNNEVVSIGNHDKMITVLQPGEIDTSYFYNAIDNLDMRKKQALRHYYSGVMFTVYRLSEFAIREFFKIIEGKDGIDGYENYEIIRDFFSHSIIAVKVASRKFLTSNIKNQFKYTEENGMIVIDVYDSSNIIELNRMAKSLMEKAKKIVFDDGN